VPSLTVGDSDGDASGNTYLVHAQTAGGGGSIVKKVSPEGLIVWENTYGISAFRLEVGSDNQAVICGFPNSGTPGSSFMKISEDGNIIWQNMNADGVYNLLLHAHLIMDSFNNVYLAAGTLFEMAVCKVNSDGSNGWIQTCSGGYANAIAIGTDYNVYVGGGNTAKFAQAPILGCTDLNACNFNSGATSDDGTCEYTSCICPGDLNGDGVISASDVLIFVPMFGCTSDCGAADLTGDGAVNTSDLLMFISLFGSSCL
jgi:Dockerin type I domain